MSEENDNRINILQNKVERLEKVISNIYRRTNVYDNELQLNREDMESIKMVVSNHSEALKELLTKAKQSVETNKKDATDNIENNDDVVKHD